MLSAPQAPAAKTLLFVIAALALLESRTFAPPPDYTLTAAPTNSQLYPRDRQTGCAVVAYRGAVSSPAYDALLLEVTRNGTAYTNVTQPLVFSGGVATFNISAAILAELVNYGFTLYLCAGASQYQISAAANVVAGDAYLINGQSNAEAILYSGSASANAHVFLRSFGAPANSAAGTTADLAWHQAVGDTRYASGMVGQWGLKFGRRLLDYYQIPIAIINAAEPGQPITYFQRNDAIPADPGTNYGRLLYRVQCAGLTNGIRAILWYQGESDYKTSAAQHESGFLDIYGHWLADYPGVERIYVHQVRQVAVLDWWTDGLDLRNRQRLFQRNYSNISVMSTTGIDAYGLSLWHYAYTGGYETIGNRAFNLVARDLYGRQFSNIEAPDVLYACFNNAAHDEIALVMANTSDTMRWGAGSQADFAINGITNAPAGGAASNNAVILKLSAPASYGTMVSYAGHATNVAPWVANVSGVGLLAFYNVPVTSPQALSFPKLTVAPSTSPGSLILSFGTAPGWFYSVEYCTNLTASGWTPLPKYVWGTGAPIQVSTARTSTPRYYRLRITSY